MLKLYKKTPAGTQYWEAWQDEDKLVTHWGTLGETGESAQIPLGETESEDAAIARESKAALSDGFEPIEPVGELVINYRVSGWGDEADLNKRYRVEGLMNECLGWTGNGHCDGGDIGSGSINIFCMCVDPEIAAQTAVDALRKEQLLEGAVVAIRFDIENGDEDYQVRWPEDFSGEFSTI